MIATTAAESNSAPPPDFNRLRAVPDDLLAKLAGDKPSVGALTKLRKLFPEEALYQHAANLPRARRKLRNKLLMAAQSFADIPRAEMATARPVALYRMARILRAAVALAATHADPSRSVDSAHPPVPAIADMTCGIGADFLALLELCRAWRLAPHHCRAYEFEPFAAWCAQANAGLLWPKLPPAADSAPRSAADLILAADVCSLPPRAPGRPPFPPATVLFLDPTRRAGGHRTVNDWAQCEPPDRLWMPWVDAHQPIGVKVAPAFDWRNFRPRTPVQVEAIEWRGEVHELTLWWNLPAITTAPATNPPRDQDLAVTREWIDHPLAFDQPAGTLLPGRRATVVRAEARSAPNELRYESLYLAPDQDAAQRAQMNLIDTPPQLGDILAIPASAVLRMDLVETLAHSLHAAVWTAQPHLLCIPPAREMAAAQSLLMQTGRVVAIVPAREKDLRRALNAQLKYRRWQPQILGLKQAPEIQKLTRVLEQHSARQKRAAHDENTHLPANGIALLTRFHPSHLVLFLEPLDGTPRP